jgi:hypothetical protein
MSDVKCVACSRMICMRARVCERERVRRHSADGILCHVAAWSVTVLVCDLVAATEPFVGFS